MNKELLFNISINIIKVNFLNLKVKQRIGVKHLVLL